MSLAPSCWGNEDGVGLMLPREDDGVGEVRLRLRSPFLTPDALVRMRFRDAAAAAAW